MWKKRRWSGVVGMDSPRRKHDWPESLPWWLGRMGKRGESSGCSALASAGLLTQHPCRTAREVWVRWTDSEADQELPEWQSSEDWDQWNRTQVEACSLWHSQGSILGPVLFNLFSSEGWRNRMYPQLAWWWHHWGEWLIHLSIRQGASGEAQQNPQRSWRSLEYLS